jgi:serine/threonine-protein kinase
MELAENVVVANRFRLMSLIGKGGMGSVWRAFDENLSTDCAIKFIEGDLAKRPEAQTRFKREAQAAAQLRSPNIVQIFDHNVWEGVPYCAMEFLDGEDLGKRLLRLKKVPHADVAYIMSEACRGLLKAHEKGIIHRDLKPDNIFLVKDDDREIVKVLDFGIAKLTEGGMDVSSGTKTGAILGTPQYMSPEQAQGTRTVDPRSDLWSLAIIAYECLTGQLPLDSKALGDLLVKIIVTPMPIPSQVDPQVPPGFDAWFAKATNRDPDLRFQNARAFADALAVSLGIVSPISPRMGSMAGAGALGANESGAHQLALGQLALGQSGPTSQPNINAMAGVAVPGGTSGAGSEAVLRPLSVTFSGGETAAGVPAKGSMAKLLAAIVGGVFVLTAIAVGILSLRPKKTDATSPVAAAESAKATTAGSAVVERAGGTTETVSVPVIAGSASPQVDTRSGVAATGSTSVTSASPQVDTRPGVAAVDTPKPKASGTKPGTGSVVAKPGPKPGGKPGGKPDLGF